MKSTQLINTFILCIFAACFGCVLAIIRRPPLDVNSYLTYNVKYLICDYGIPSFAMNNKELCYTILRQNQSY